MRVKAENLTKVYCLGSSLITAVNDVNLEVNEGALVAVVGRSGSGKSTLLNLIGLNDNPTSGNIFVDDVNISGLSGRERRRMRLHRMGFVFQTFNLLPTLSAVENVELPMALANAPRKERREKAMRLLETVCLGNRLSHRPKELSMGEMQRVAIARALANDPELIIADEPTGELDSKTAEETVSLLLDINRKDGKTVIVATHDENIVKLMDIVYTLQDGKLRLES
jgi:putative ABC transport system ATP-binding protein